MRARPNSYARALQVEASERENVYRLHEAFEKARDAFYGARRIVEIVNSTTTPRHQGWALAYRYGGPSSWVPRPLAEVQKEQRALRVQYDAARAAYESARRKLDGLRAHRNGQEAFRGEIAALRAAGSITEVESLYARRRSRECRDAYIKKLLHLEGDVPPVLIEAKRTALQLKRFLRTGELPVTPAGHVDPDAIRRIKLSDLKEFM